MESLVMSSVRLVMFAILVGTLVWGLRVAGGRLAPKAALTPLVYLVTRVPVMVMWVVGSAGMFWMLTAAATANGKELAGQWPMVIGVSLLCGGGVAALVVGPGWVVSRIGAKVAELPFADGEEVLFQAAANHFLNGEARGGRVFVTAEHLAFRPHRFNVQLDTWMMPLSKLKAAYAEGTRFVVIEVRGSEQEEWLVVMNAAKVAGYLSALLSVEHAQRSAQNLALLQQADLRG